jgi:hypothetical protein
MQPIVNLAKECKIFLISSFVLFFAYSLNYFNVISYENFVSFQSDSESLVVNRISCTMHQGRDFESGMLILPPQTLTEECSSDNAIAYTSQFGIQGRIFSLFAPDSHEWFNRYVGWFKILMSILFVGSLSLFLQRVGKEFGSSIAIGTLLLISLSIWPALFSRNLYWVIFIHFLPFIFSWYFYPYFKKTNRTIAFLVLIALLVCIKALAGYEFITNVILSATVPAIYYELKSKSSIRNLIRPTFSIFIAGIVGFGLAAGMHFAMLSNHFGSTAKAFGNILDRAAIRTVSNEGNLQFRALENFQGEHPSLYHFTNTLIGLERFNENPGEELFNYLWIAFKYGNTSIIQPPIAANNYLAFFSTLFGFSLIVFAIIARNRIHLFNKDAADRPLLWLVITGFCASLSWAILAAGHMLNHTHLASIIFYLPFLLLSYVLVSKKIVEAWRRHYATK